MSRLHPHRPASPALAASTPRHRTRFSAPAGLRRALLFLLAPLLLLAAPALHAQFNGPALPPSASINRPSTPTTDPAILYPANRELTLSASDLVTVKVFGPGDYTYTVRIGTDGKVQLPLIGVVALQGLTITSAENLIAERLLTAGMYRDPQVTVQLMEGPSATISVVGEVHGVVPIVGQRRLLDVLSLAGGLPPTASHIITIDRPGLPQPITVDLGTDPARSALANIPVFAGDTILTARVGVVYVLGAFRTQGAIPVAGNSPLTLLQVTALSGGPLFEGNFKDLRIIRTIGNQRTLVQVDIKKVMYGKAPDPVLQADDIVFLPDSNLKAAIKNGGVGILFSAASVFISVLTYSKVQ